MMRVYELAKELGLENKEVINLCVDLGISGKKSHSNSLTDEEANRIRRSVIRQAVSGKKGSVREIEMQGGVGTEQRLGNVIRRRKKDSDGEEETQAEAAAPKIDLAEVPRKSVVFREDSQEPGFEKDSRQRALREADALFAKKKAEIAAVPEEAEQFDSQADTAVLEPQSEEEEFEQRSEPRSEEGLQVVEESGAALELSPELGDTSSEGFENVSLDKMRLRHDIRAPKILGKISLPQKPVVAKREASSTKEFVALDPTESRGPGKSSRGQKKQRGEGLNGDATLSDFVDETPRRLKRKKQVLKKDELVDYTGSSDYWRHKKDRKGKKSKDLQSKPDEQVVGQTKASKLVLKIDNEVSVGEFARLMGQKVGDVMTHLFNLGVMARINDIIDFDTATIVAQEFGFTTTNTGHDEIEFLATLNVEENPAELILRPPVVTVMGHVDHGKTSLLDAIRKTSVTTGEAGGITQHIGAYNVPVPTAGGSVTFLDTPGHEAFTEMRGRGVKVTDIVVLVVAADDGVMPQTVEAINHARAANVPIIVAVNKIDKPGANIDRVISQLAEHGLIPEDWGGTTIFCRVSAHTKEGIDALLESLYLQAEVLELRANPNRLAMGTVIESKIDRGRGPVMTVLVASGTLKKGDVFLSGAVTGKVRALISHDGQNLESIGPGMPAEVLGASTTPRAGDDFLVLESEAEARRVSEHRALRQRMKELAAKRKTGQGTALTLESFSEMVASGDVKELPIIVKADVQGSVEAISQALVNLSNEKVKVKVVHQAVGGISENDVQLAIASRAVIVAFNVRANVRATALIESEQIDVRYSRVIYELIDEVQKAMTGLLDPVFREKTIGRVEVRQTFKVPKLGTVAGSYVVDGIVQRGAQARLIRDDVVIFEGKIASLRRFKDDVREVATGYECGIGLEGYNDIREGDTLEFFKLEEVQQ